MVTINSIIKSLDLGRIVYTIDLLIEIDGDKEGVTINLPPGKWNKSIVVDKLIRSKYPQDAVEAIINNHFLNISEWLDKKFKGEDILFVDLEYDKLQEWRKISKNLADDIIKRIEEGV